MREIDYGFEKVDIKKFEKVKKIQKVWIGLRGKNPQKVFVSSDLMKDLGWDDSTKVELMQSRDGRALAIKKVDHMDGFKIRMYGKSGAINSSAFAVKVYSAMRVAYHKDVFEYDAKILDDFIIFFPKCD